MRITSLLAVTSLSAVVACGGGGPDRARPDADDLGPPDAGDPPDAPAPACDVSGVPTYQTIETTPFVVSPSATAQGGEVINDVVSGQLKRHQVVVPTDPALRQDKLLVWLAGSGTEPPNYDTILQMAASAGYAAISLAYDNEISVAERCGQPIDGNPECSQANADCDELARQEVVYGRDVFDSPCLDVATPDSITHRVLRLLQHLDAVAPAAGADVFLTADGADIAWAKIAVGGWSQGGGHAGLISRDQLVARALFLSRGGDSALCPAVEPDTTACDLDGDGMLTMGNVDEWNVPAPWTAEPRVTPGSRLFGAVHRRENEWSFSNEVFELYGMGPEGGEVDLDAVGDDYAAFSCKHTFATNATPACDATSFHKSMALDACLARVGGVPVLAPFFYYALTVPVPDVP